MNKISKNVHKPNEALKKATNKPIRKYGVPPNKVEKKSIESEEYKLSYGIDRIRKVDKDAVRSARYNPKDTKSQKRNLGLLYRLAKSHLLYPTGINKKMHLLFFYKSSTDKKTFFNKDKKFAVTKRFENHRGTGFYRIQELDTARETEKRFLRKKLFALENNVQRG